MVQSRRGARFGTQPPDEIRILFGKSFREELDSHIDGQALVLGEIDRAHTTFTELVKNLGAAEPFPDHQIRWIFLILGNDGGNAGGGTVIVVLIIKIFETDRLDLRRSGRKKYHATVRAFDLDTRIFIEDFQFFTAFRFGAS